MTLAQEAQETAAVSTATESREVPKIPALRVPALLLTNGSAGISTGGPVQYPATALPAPISLAATWDPALAARYGEVEDKEALDQGRDDIEELDINIARIPTNGRTFEAYGEDPYLAGQIAAGGTGPMGPNAVPADNGDYNPNSLSTRPAYGFYLRGVDGITFNDASLRLAADDARPAFIANTGSDIMLRDVRAQAGSDSPFDVGFQDVAGYCLEGTRTTADGTPRVSTPGSSLTDKGCSASLDNFSLSAAPASGGVTLVVSGLSVADTANAAAWSVQQNLQPGDVMYGDRTTTVASVPTELTGATWIRTANSSKSATENPLVTFTISTPATVAVAVDTRMGRLPWMDSSWTDSGTRVTDSESTSRAFEVYTKTFPAGTVTLGPQADETNGTSMYTIGVF
jgi:hypothetical protein